LAILRFTPIAKALYENYTDNKIKRIISGRSEVYTLLLLNNEVFREGICASIISAVHEE
jgi:hypothetical protein